MTESIDLNKLKLDILKLREILQEELNSLEKINERDLDQNKRVKELKQSLDFSIKIIIGHLIWLGAVTNIISALNKGLRTVNAIASEYGYKNKELLNSYLNTLAKYDIIGRKNGEFFLHSNPRINLEINDLRITKPAEDLTTFLTSILKFFPYAIIDSHHPAVTTSFEKDCDIWDIWLNNEWYQLAREVIAEVGGIEEGECILDLGCGSVSPLFYAKLVRSRGKIQGIEKSEGLVNIARRRALKNSYGWVDIKRANIEEKIVFKEKYDAAILADVLQYINDVKTVFKNIKGGLKKGGRVIVFTKCFGDSNSTYLPALEFVHSLIPGYRRFISRVEITRLLQELGFKVDLDSVAEDMILVAYKEVLP